MNSENKIDIVHFANGSGGGVFSVIRNLLQYSSNPRIQNHVIFTINKKQFTDFKVPEITGASSIQTFYYSPTWNFYHTCKQLAKLLPDEKAVIVAHDWLELGMASHLGMQNPVVQFLHGDYDYYYELAIKHSGAIDYFACVSPTIQKKLQSLLPERKNEVFFLPYPVPEINYVTKQPSGKLRVLFCVRDLNDDSKQFSLLPSIKQECTKRGVEVQWTIIGSGKKEEEVKNLLGEDTRYFSSLTNERVIEEMNQSDVLVHPSLIEGFPVVVVEGMKAGLVPLISDWAGSTSDLVIEGETGFYFKAGDSQPYAERIVSLNQNRNFLDEISKRARQKAESLFDPYQNTIETEQLYTKTVEQKRKKKAKKVYGSFLDKKWISNWGVVQIRRFINLRSSHPSIKSTINFS